jgi:hypothetical protein
MRNLLNKLLQLNEDLNPTTDELEAFKNVIASKIKQLPDDDATAKTLREIEDLLKYVHAGGKMGIINGELQKIEDATVLAAQKELAKYIYSLEMDPKEREEMFTLWRDNKLVDCKKLLSKGKHSFSDIVRKYDSNSGIRNFVNEIMRISALGQGKGEFGLSVLSKDIAKPHGKGDLIILGRKIEVKTFDKAAARFTDQEVIPASGYAAAAENLNAFVRQRSADVVTPKYGINLLSAAKFGSTLTGADKVAYYKLSDQLIKLIFGGPKGNSDDINAVITAFKDNDANAVRQAYARASFNYYMGMKDDDGVLSLDISGEPITSIFYRDANELAEAGQRFDAETAYISAPTFREVYPKISIVPTSFGANAKAKAEKLAQQTATKAAKSNPVTAPIANPYPVDQSQRTELEDRAFDFAQNFAAQRGIFDPDTISEIAFYAIDQIESGVPPETIKTMLPKLIPALQPAAKPAAQQAPATDAAQQPPKDVGRQRRA